jgi:hypothetical protein
MTGKRGPARWNLETHRFGQKAQGLTRCSPEVAGRAGMEALQGSEAKAQDGRGSGTDDQGSGGMIDLAGEEVVGTRHPLGKEDCPEARQGDDSESFARGIEKPGSEEVKPKW